MALAVIAEKNRPKIPVVGREMQGRRWLSMVPKVLNRNGNFIDIERVTGFAEISSAPFVRN
jgi:hypothetical protein